jgi:TonB family protein
MLEGESTSSMNKMRQVMFALIATSNALLAQSATPLSPAAVQPRQILETSKRRGQLEMADTLPYHLKASYQLFSADGKPAETGTLDELWEDPSHYRLAIGQPGGELLEIRNDEQHWRTGKWQIENRIMLAMNGALKPFWDVPAGDRLFVEVPPNRDPNLDCIGTEPDIPGVGMDVRLAETTYCMSKGSHLLRLILRPSGFSIRLNDTQPFGEKKYIPRSIDIPGGSGVMIRLHIDSLSSADDFSALAIPVPSDAQVLQGDGEPLELRDAAGVPFGEGLLGQVIDSPTPRAPSAAGHGAVVLRVRIDTSGKVLGADVISSPNSVLGAFAVGVVKNWRYRVSHQGDKLIFGVQTVSLQF